MTTTYPSFTPTYHHAPYPAILPTQKHLSCEDKTVLITGAGTGIGQAIAVAFAQAHAKGIVVLGRTKSTLEETISLVKAASDDKTEPLLVTADITDKKSVQSAFESISSKFAGVDILVNCAGGSLAFGSVADIDLDGFWKTFELNVLGAMTLTQAFIRTTQEDTARERTIINIPSGAAHLPYAPTAVAYATSKMACAKIAEYVHYEHRNWRVFNLQPGVVATALAKKTGRRGEDVPELCAAMCVWLSRDPRAAVLNGRFIWANWDVEELLAKKDEIIKNDSLMLGLKGWAEGYTADDLRKRAAAVHNNVAQKQE